MSCIRRLPLPQAEREAYFSFLASLQRAEKLIGVDSVFLDEKCGCSSAVKKTVLNNLKWLRIDCRFSQNMHKRLGGDEY